MPVPKDWRATPRYGTRQLILRAFDAVEEPRTLTTSSILERVANSTKSKIPEHSVRSALRTLVRQRTLWEREHDRVKTYTLRPAAGLSRTSREALPARATRGPTRRGASRQLPSATTGTRPLSLPRRLGVGEGLVLRAHPDRVEVLVNSRGRLSVEWRARRRARTG